MQQKEIPIALFAYARPIHLIQVLDGLKRNQVPLIYAFCDGSKDGEKIEEVEEVRKILKNVNWTDIRIIERNKNWGLATSIRAGITEVFLNYDKVIVIEDDIVMRPGAYSYTCEALNYFESDDHIMTISMWTHPILTPKKSAIGFFSERFVCWGWATYKKYWTQYTNTPEDHYLRTIKTRPDLLKWGKDLKTQALNSSKYNIWYAGYAILHFELNKLSYFPSESLTINIGRDSTATNPGVSIIDDENLITKPIFLPDKFPEPIINKSLAKKFRMYFDYKNVSSFKRHFKKLKRYLLK